MRMSSGKLGTSTSAVEVTNISAHGFWVLLGEEELFLPYEQFPWFADEPVSKIANVENPGPDHLFWPDLDVDLSIESIRHPENFPLRAKHQGR